MPEKIAVFSTVGSAVKGVASAVVRLAPNAAFPLLTTVTLAVYREDLFEPHELFSLAGQLYSIVAALPVALFAFVCHRECLAELGIATSTSSSPVLPFLAWSLGAVAMFSLVDLVAPGLAFGEAGELVETDTLSIGLNSILSIAATVTLVRCGLMLPAIVAGEPPSPRTAWRRSRGNAWRLFWASSMAPCLVVLPVLIALQINQLLPTPGGAAIVALTPLRIAVNSAFGIAIYCATAAGAFVLCAAYAKLRGQTHAA